MWIKLAGCILRYRIYFLIGIAAVTALLSTQIGNLKVSYQDSNMLSTDDPVFITYENFKNTFGKEDNVILLGIKDSALFSTPEKFRAWVELNERIQSDSVVGALIGINNVVTLHKDTVSQSFVPQKFLQKMPEHNYELAQVRRDLYELPVYSGKLYSDNHSTVLSMVSVKQEYLLSKTRAEFVERLQGEVDRFEEANDTKVYVSGLPYIRVQNTKLLLSEVKFFVALAFLVTALIFFLIFRSFRATLIAMLVVAVGVVWTLGITGAFGYELSILTALIPPLIIIIGIPNVIFLLNRYHTEYNSHGNKVKSLARVIIKVGNATLMSNLTTAAGFATFIFTSSALLVEFGIIASLSILSVFILSLLIIPIMYSYMKVPTPRHLKYLDKAWAGSFSKWKIRVIQNQRPAIFIIAIALMGASVFGIAQMYVSGSLLEDMPKKSEFIQDTRYFEQEFNGVMPLEIVVDALSKRSATRLETLQKMDELEHYLDMNPEMSRALSIVTMAKYAKQSYYNGNPEYYSLPTKGEFPFIFSYLRKSQSGDAAELLKNYTDSTGQKTRISVMLKDVGTMEMEKLHGDIQKQIDRIFPEDKYKVDMTGSAFVFLRGTNVLVNNLFSSLGLAIVLIALFMAFSFRSFKMILVSLLPNILPLLMTAGIMGYAGIPIKASTILVFSIAFGISVDDTIHFLTKYRQELDHHAWKIGRSVRATVKDMGISMFYTSIVLFFGFGLFATSSFGGTAALGVLIAITLLVAMFSNLILLPALLLAFKKKVTDKEFKEHKLIKIPLEEHPLEEVATEEEKTHPQG